MSAPAARLARERWLAQQWNNKRRHRRIFKRRVLAIANTVERPHVFDMTDHDLATRALELARFAALPWWRRLWLRLTGRSPRWTR